MFNDNETFDETIIDAIKNHGDDEPGVLLKAGKGGGGWTEIIPYDQFEQRVFEHDEQ